MFEQTISLSQQSFDLITYLCDDVLSMQNILTWTTLCFVLFLLFFCDTYILSRSPELSLFHSMIYVFSRHSSRRWYVYPLDTLFIRLHLFYIAATMCCCVSLAQILHRYVVFLLWGRELVSAHSIDPLQSFRGIFHFIFYLYMRQQTATQRF